MGCLALNTLLVSVATSIFFGGLAGATAQIIHQYWLRKVIKRDAVRAIATEMRLNDVFAQHNAWAAEHGVSHILIPFRTRAAEHFLLEGHYALSVPIHTMGRDYLLALDHIGMMLNQARNPSAQAIQGGLNESIQRYCRDLLDDTLEPDALSYQTARNGLMSQLRAEFKRWIPDKLLQSRGNIQGEWVSSIHAGASRTTIAFSARVRRFSSGSSRAGVPSGDTVHFDIEVDIVNPNEELFIITGIDASLIDLETVLFDPLISLEMTTLNDPHGGTTVQPPIRVPGGERILLRVRVLLPNKKKDEEQFAAHIWDLLCPATLSMKFTVEDMHQQQTASEATLVLLPALEAFVRQTLSNWGEAWQLKRLLNVAQQHKPKNVEFPK